MMSPSMKAQFIVGGLLGLIFNLLIMWAFPAQPGERAPSVSDIAPEHAVMLPRVEKGVRP